MNKARVSWFNSQKIVNQLLYETTLAAAPYFSGKVLDVGCGKKPYRVFLSGSKVQKWIGLDLPTSESGKTEADVYGSALDIPFRTEIFETVFCSQVLEHVTDPARIMKEIARVLKVGGHLVLTAPQTWCLHEEPNDFFRFTKYGLSFLAENNGLVVEYVKPYGGTIALLGQLIALHGHSIFPIFRILYAIFSYFILRFDRVWVKEKDILGNIIVCTKSR